MNNLTITESEQIFTQIMSGKMPEADIGEFLLALKAKGETADEILGAVKVFRARCQMSDSGFQNVVDVCGTGGDGLNTLNISTAVAFVLAGAGVDVAKHGNKAVSSKSGSSDVLNELGMKIDADPVRQLKAARLAYFHAPNYHEAMKIVAPIRAKLQSKTIFNLLGPLLNPAHAKRQLIGVYDAKYLRVFAEVLRQLGTEKAWIVNGADGLDELSISGETQVAELANGAIDIFTVTPEDAGLKRYPLDAIKGGDAKHNAQAIIRLLDGETGAYQEIVLLNSAAALLVAGVVDDLKAGVELARRSIESGSAKKVLENLRKL